MPPSCASSPRSSEEGRKLAFDGLVDIDSRPALRRALDSALARQGLIDPVDIAFAGARERSGRIYLSPIDESEGHDEAAIAYAIDTTEQRALEMQIAHGQKMQAVGQLAGGIAHDFNNMLTAIIGFSDFLLMNHRPTDPAFQDIINIKQNANRAAGLVRQLLAFSRQQTLRPQVLQLGDVLSELSILLGRLLNENIELTLDQASELWPVKADLHQFEQVIINLAVNARDAMPDGGKLVIRTANVGESEALCASAPATAARRLRADPGDRHRDRHERRGAREDLRAVLLDQGGRPRHRTWPLHRLRHRQADRRLCLRRQRGGQGHRR